MTRNLRSAISPTSVGLVAVGGAAGAGVRWAVIPLVDTGGAFPWPTLLVNVIGCVLLGLLLGVDEGTRLLAGVGFCGGLTTFSTFSVEIAQLLDDGSTATAATYLTASLTLGIAGIVVGWRAAPAR